MYRLMKIAALASIVALVGIWSLDRARLVEAEEETKPAKTALGGILAKTARYQFEVFFYPTGVRVFPKTAAGGPVDVSRTTGVATFYHPNSVRPWFSRPLHGTSGQTPASLDLAVGLGNAPATGARVTFEVSGLADTADSRATFTVPLEFVPPAATVVRPPQGETFTVPRYTYCSGHQGYGYYEHTSPGTYSTPSGPHSYMSSIPGMYGPGGMTVGPGHRDWTTGRSSPLAKPWLRAMD